MANQQQNSQDQPQQEPWPGLPKPLAHRLSMKWTTLESLRILQERLSARGHQSTVVLLTALGVIEGQLADFCDSYEDSVAFSDVSKMDIPSAVAHLRTNLWAMYSEKDKELQPVDSGAVIHLTEVVFRMGGRTVRFPHMAVFASDVIAFTLSPRALVQ